jgi:uncharacterized RDD family membrane protein YckC
MRTLSIGNIVTASLKIYCLHLSIYLSLTIEACLWLFIPIYGLGKFFTATAIMSRLAFTELIGQPESLQDIKIYTKNRCRLFLFTGLITNLILITTIALWLFLELLILGAIGFFTEKYLNPLSLEYSIIALTAFLLITTTFVVGVNWIYSRLIIAGVPLAVEEDLSSFEAIKRSWSLTQGFLTAYRIQGIFAIASLVLLPILFFTQIGSYLIHLLAGYFYPQFSESMMIIYTWIEVSLFLILSCLFLPFWQILKTVLYYDLRTKKEGFGLDIFSRNTLINNSNNFSNSSNYLRILNPISLQTPESVELEMNLAGIGNRAWGLLIDYSILGLSLFVFWVGWISLAINFLDPLRAYFSDDRVGIWLLAIATLISYFTYTGYFVVFETLWYGQTPGKRLAKIRVIRDDGTPLTIFQATLRSLFRPVDDLMFLGAFLIVFIRQEKRLGDFAAGTIVIEVASTSATNKINISQQAQLEYEKLLYKVNLSLLTPDNFSSIKEYLLRRKIMHIPAKRQLTRKLANQLLDILRLNEIPETLSAEEFLEAVYLAYQKEGSRESFYIT